MFFVNIKSHKERILNYRNVIQKRDKAIAQYQGLDHLKKHGMYIKCKRRRKIPNE